ncbi:MAG: type II toxin-antitoxin system ParD family antitoxin [Bryobacterales bacterium]|nr:type II toxin-antitoxin system ParD family antitoxin [Bryobacterales bacterium]
MTIQLTPEDEKLIQSQLQSGAFQSVEEVIHDALASQAAENEWLIHNKDQLNEKIARGIAQIDRGEGISGTEARARLEQRKADWRKQNNA